MYLVFGVYKLELIMNPEGCGSNPFTLVISFAAGPSYFMSGSFPVVIPLYVSTTYHDPLLRTSFIITYLAPVVNPQSIVIDPAVPSPVKNEPTLEIPGSVAHKYA